MIRTAKKSGRCRILLPGEVFKINSKFKIQSSKLFVALFSGLLLAGCFHKGKPENVGKPAASQGEGIEIEDRISKLSKQFGVSVPDGVKKAALESVDGSPSSGIATLDEKTGSPLITILANLPDLEKKETYTAQLVGGERPVSLGVLTIAKGGWMIERKANIDLSIFKTVEVLKGPQVVLRGSF